MAMNGADVLLLVNTGTILSPTYTVVGSQRGVTFGETTSEIDASSKDSRAGRVLPGRYAASIKLDNLYVPSNIAYQALQDAMRNGTFILVRRQEQGADLEEADAVVTELTTDAPDQDVTSCSISLTIDGEWAVVGT